jgi:plasmid stability protein
MGDMTIRGIDDATIAALRREAERRGLEPAECAAELLREALPARGVRAGGVRDRSAVARRILASQPTCSPISSVDLLREMRDEDA